MLVLGIDTCGATGTVALVWLKTGSSATRKVIAEAELGGKTYSAMLVLSIRALLERAEAELADLAAIVVVNGPGSFTGVRVGLSATKGLAEAAEIPVLAMSRLAVLAGKANRDRSSAVLDAGRGELYVRLFQPEGREELLAPSGELENLLEPGSPLVVCEPALAAAFSRLQPELAGDPTATDAIRLAAPRIFSGHFDDLTALDGNYLRRSDAEIFAKPKTLPA